MAGLRSLKVLTHPVIRIPQSGYFPIMKWRPFLGQGSLIDIKPEIKIDKPSIPINIDLGSLPLSVGLFAASGLTFLLRTALPDGWPKTVALIGGGGLAAAGVVNLVLPKAKAAPAAPASPAAPPSGAAAAEDKPAGFVPPSTQAFIRVQAEMVSPQSDQEVEHLGWLLTSDRIPIVMRFYNPSAEPVAFNLDFEWDEYPSLVGYNREPNHGAKSFQVSLAANEERNQSFELPVATGGFSTSLTVGMTLYKKRTPEENRVLLLSRTFVVT